ncbi:DMT family transporter [Deinococcus peraridilitoris]|uniref:Putative permease, DMT superfamily n=1 Tax=Deinococcus peraridilitoris (strain DSM 19664 / LMG 22246 / CIP 109416 / KR-200) TaxID=937777 RepID=L0A2L8_DEIPD|nr:DMT family transporter [Deinococcus peraridilitoris]AFZ67684.1 putative permease, DMT superfamily [Deinococcus peraridilitoris DSM 19664]
MSHSRHTALVRGPQRPLRGVAFFALALLLFACLDATAKYLTTHYPVPLIAWVRYAGQFLLMTALIVPFQGRRILVTQRTGLVVLRSMCLVVLTFLMISGLRLLPLAEATSIVFIAPLLVVLLARPLLQERIGTARAVAVVVGFAGVLLIARPGGDLHPGGVALILMAAVLNASYQLLSRLLSTTERTANQLYWSALLGTVSFLLFLPWFWSGPAPSLELTLLLLSLGVTGGLGHLCFTLAFRDAPASLLAPVTYLQLVWAGLLGWLVFGQLPDALTLTGMLVVALSGVTVTVFGRRA